ncbi:penicillin-binding protein 2A [Paenibacillaceae bacterium GAS479]|nr:penicillin-binding protein 2A [Paenibacillaceae bacterium GAS479]
MSGKTRVSAEPRRAAGALATVPDGGAAYVTAGRRGRFRLKNIFFWLYDATVICTLAALLLAFCLYATGEWLTRDGPEPDRLSSFETVVIDRYGKRAGLLQQPGQGTREAATADELTPLLKAAFVAVEDKRFYEHAGVDVKAIVRAAGTNAAAGRVRQGGSTITQQLARTLYLSNDRTWVRKGLELSAALALERKHSKEELLAGYLNEVYMGKQLYGIKAAAKFYFGVKSLEQLKLWQIATLAGIPKGPALYNPLDQPAQSSERRLVVLKLMRSQGLISAQELQEAAKVRYSPPASNSSKEVRLSSALLDTLMKEASRLTKLSRDELMKEGLTISTGWDPAAQAQLDKVFADEKAFPRSASGKPVQAAAVLLDNESAEIRALAGGRGSGATGLNRALARRQPGSMIKPLAVYGPALESGKYSPDSLLEDQAANYSGYKPKNLSGRYSGRMMMREALQKSTNAPAVWLLDQIGMKASLAFMERVGIQTERDDRHLALALGGWTRGITPLEAAQAFRAFAAGGFYREGHLITSIRDRSGKLLYEAKSKETKAMSQTTAARMNDMLLQVVREGTGRQAGVGGLQAAGKTGTTQLPGAPAEAARDAWFAGYTGNRTLAVWIGLDSSSEDYMIATGADAARVFRLVMD